MTTESSTNNPRALCGLCGAELVLTVDMGRVEAGIGGPRPCFICPKWDEEHAEVQRAEIARNTTVTSSNTIQYWNMADGVLEQCCPADNACEMHRGMQLDD